MLGIGEIMYRHGSDKSGSHNYGGVYDSLFPTEESRAAVQAVLEIGVAQGCSIRGWLEVFLNATVVGMDEHLCVPHMMDFSRYRHWRCDQKHVTSMTRFLHHSRQTFDLIVDDASHFLADQLLSLFVLWPHLKSGGWYVIEELDMYERFTDDDGRMLTGGGKGPAAWREHVGLLRGASMVDTVAVNGVVEQLVVLKKD